ncbi:MAG: exodeoxyribonuclease VII small subunit [Gammaproteobacteria bacterium]
MTRKKSEAFNFEAALAELTTLVEQMEQGGLSLEQSLSSFEKGVQLTRQCQKALQDAEQKVQILLEKNKQLELVDYEDENEEEDE